MNRNENIIKHTISTIKKYRLLCQTLKYGAYGVIIYTKPTILLIPLCEAVIKYL